MASVHRVHCHERDDIASRLDLCNSDISDKDGSKETLEERYKFFQEMRGYVRDLVDCLSEKVGSHLHFDVGYLCLGPLVSRGHVFTVRSFGAGARILYYDFACSSALYFNIIADVENEGGQNFFSCPWGMRIRQCFFFVHILDIFK